MNDLDVEESDEPDEPEDVFRRVMDYATDEAWDLQVDEEALAALYDVLHLGQHRRSGRGCRPWCSRASVP